MSRKDSCKLKPNYKPLLDLSFYVVFVGEKSGNFEKEMSKT